MPESAGYWCKRLMTITVLGPHGRSIHAIDRPWARVGSHPAAEILLPATDAAPCGIYFHATDTGIYCAGLAPAAAIVRAETSTLPLRLGRYTVFATLEGATVAAAGPLSTPLALPTLEAAIAGKPSTTRRHSLGAEITLVGSQPPATLRVERAGLAPAHCVLFVAQDRLWIIDLLSEQGTRLDGYHIDAQVLRTGGLLELGNLRVRSVATASVPAQPQEAQTATEAASVDPDQLTRRDAGSDRSGFPATIDNDAMVRHLTTRLVGREQDRKWTHLTRMIALAVIVCLILGIGAAFYVWFSRHRSQSPESSTSAAVRVHLAAGAEKENVICTHSSTSS